MDRTITVRGTGSVSVAPDLTVLRVTLKSLDKEYEKAMADASAQIAKLQAAVQAVGFAEEDLKTESFNVCSEYEGVQDERGNYKNVFKGYACMHAMKLEFAFDTKLLSAVLSAAAKSTAEPELNISFTVKDKNAVSEALLKNAAENARQKAEILCAASGVRLGELLSVNYDWSELHMVSPTSFGMERQCMAKNAMADMAFHPDDISVSDSAAFVWQII